MKVRLLNATDSKEYPATFKAFCNIRQETENPISWYYINPRDADTIRNNKFDLFDDFCIVPLAIWYLLTHNELFIKHFRSFGHMYVSKHAFQECTPTIQMDILCDGDYNSGIEETTDIETDLIDSKLMQCIISFYDSNFTDVVNCYCYYGKDDETDDEIISNLRNAIKLMNITELEHLATVYSDHYKIERKVIWDGTRKWNIWYWFNSWWKL